MSSSTVNHLIHTLNQALLDLGKAPDPADVESMAMMIHRAMDHPRRAYHTSQHVLKVCAGNKPLVILAGLYHDFVYFQLDNGFPADVETMLSAAIARRDDDFVLCLSSPGGALAELCAAVFGYVDGAILPPLAGLNEFASALVATTVLAPYLSPAETLALVTCIETTIPFRIHGPDGLSMPESLLRRLQEANQKFRLQLDHAQLRLMVRDAVDMANQDVGGFAAADPCVFLSDTWLLIEESNALLVSLGTYTIQDYRSALFRMERFLAQLDPVSIFHPFDGLPSAAEYAEKVAAARQNLEFSQRYLATRLVAFAIIEAIAQVSGGDCPLSMLLGHIGHAVENPLQIEDFFPVSAVHRDVDPSLLELLEKGRYGLPFKDLSRAPLSAHVYGLLGEPETLALFERAKQFFNGQMAPADFLFSVNPELRRSITQACAKVFVSCCSCSID